MNRVAVKNEMIARRTPQVVVAHGHVTGVASRLREVRQSHLSRTCAARYRVEVATLRSQGVQQRKCPFSMQPFGTMALRAAYGVGFLVKGMAINFEVFLASHPAKPLSRSCGT